MDKPLQRTKNKAVVFRPRRNFRILVGSEYYEIIVKDLAAYNKHLYQVFTALAKVDNKAPFLNPYTYVSPRKLREDADRLQRIDSENKELIGRINAINRKPATVDCWNTYSKGVSRRRINYNRQCMATMKDNLKVLSSIENAKSLYNREIMNAHWKKMSRAFDETIKLTKVFHTKPSIDEYLAASPSISGLDVQYVFPRRKVYLDFSIKNGVRLGQVVIELYYEHAPKMVKNFLAHCDESAEFNYKDTRVHYAEKNKFICLGDVTKQNGSGGNSIYRRNLKLKSNSLQSTRSGLLVALPIRRKKTFNPNLSIKQQIRKKPAPLEYNSLFAITLSDCSTLTPIFGKVVTGNSVLLKINDLLRKLGTPTVTILISRCGCIPFRKEEADLFATVERQMLDAGIVLESEDEEQLGGE